MKILFVPFTPSLAHLTRCLSVAESMKERGHDCRFAIGCEGKKFIEKAGFTIYPVPEISGDTFKNVRGWSWLSEKYVQDNLNAELSIIDEFHPELIVFDFRFTSGWAAKIKSVPSISIMHLSALTLALNPKQTALEIISFSDSVSTNKGRMKIFQFLFPAIFVWMIRRPVRHFMPILKQYGFTKPDSVFKLLIGDRVLIADPKEFIGAKTTLPENCIIAGPLLWKGWNENFTFPGPDSKPVIYITMGSTVDARSTLLKLIDSLKELPFNIIISTGSMQLDVPEKPENVHLYSFVPGKVVAARSSLVIYHGGHETLIQVLSAGVPSLVVPVNPDQILVARQIKELGIGDYLRSPGSFPMEKDPLKKISTMEICEEALRIIDDDSCRIRCMELKEKMNGYIGRKSYVRQLEEI